MTDNIKTENNMPKKKNFEPNSIEDLEIEINFNYEFADEKLTQTPQRYIFNVISPSKLKCNFCPSTYDDENDLQMHVKEAHKEIQKMTGENVSLKSYSKIDKNNKPFECIHCKEVFFTSKHLHEHQKSHSDPITCKKCNRSFSKKQYLEMHLKSHKTEKNYSCSVCGKMYITKDHLKRHMNVHTGELNITCDICNKVFCRKYNFRQHMNIHMGNKPFQCVYCEKAFFTSNHLYVHKRSTHFDKNTCKTCNKTFSRKSDLAKHLLSKKHIRTLRKDTQ